LEGRDRAARFFSGGSAPKKTAGEDSKKEGPAWGNLPTSAPKMSRTTMLLILSSVAGVIAGCGQRRIGRLPDAAMGGDTIVHADTGADAQADAAVDETADAPVDTPADAADDARDGSADLADDTDGADDGPPVIPDLPQVCTATGWCWTHPLPTGDRFVQVAGVAPDDTWLLGASGVILRR